VGTTDILPQLIHEHQAGFVNRVLQAGYAARTMLHNNGGNETEEAREKLKPLIRELLRYILFVDEAKLPAGGIEGDLAFVEDFRKNRRVDAHGASLKDFDLRRRMFRYRCSYMIHSSLLDALPPMVKRSVFAGVTEALQGGADGAHIPDPEKAVIRSILRATHPEFARLGN
jgi:hypothetical protein